MEHLKIFREFIEYQKRAISKKSNFNVGAVIYTNFGNEYGGFNIEFDMIEMTLHAEQTAYINFLLNKKSGEYPIKIHISATPCGHCRQFLSSFGDDMIVEFDDKKIKLSDLLPYSFDEGLGESIGKFSIDNNISNPEKLVKYLADKSITSFTKLKSGCVIEAKSGKLYRGFFIENNAFNPSVNPITMALCDLYLNNEKTDNIKTIYITSNDEFDITGPLRIFKNKKVEVKKIYMKE